MRSTAKILAGIAIAVVLFVFAAYVELTARSRYGGTMSIDGLPINNARVTGTWTPDIFWVGKAWAIEIQSAEDLELRLDGRVYVIPKGSHELYSNHDATNTGKFGSRDFWGYPEKVEVRPLNRMP
ncbi:MAG: hypothetical protein EA381_14975 [Planctomycetaceae bacterium]|nr:MAG: hypothetical protein EA381_14975 [Planctomycetaceae bacterium]